MNKEVLRLAGLLACLALAASRIGLVLHELVAHGGMAVLFGAHIGHVEMFWFGGGWIHYTLPDESTGALLAISMAGIAIELVTGTTLQLVGRGEGLGHRLLRGAGLALIVHATWYLATGAFYGFGDGLVLYRLLGDARVGVAIGAGLATCVAAYAGARTAFGALLGTLPGSAGRRILGLVIAVLLASGLHAALTVGEMRIRQDQTYAHMMQPEQKRVIARELEAWQREQAARGAAPSAQARRAHEEQLEEEHRSFPFIPLLALATLASVVIGAWRSPKREQRITSGLLFRTAVIAITSIWSVIVIDGLIS